MIDRYLQRHVKLIHTGVSQLLTGHPEPPASLSGSAEALGVGGQDSCVLVSMEQAAVQGARGRGGVQTPTGGVGSCLCMGDIAGALQNP